jgi:Cu(I)/Ag(I) efflux system membrane protein CusA/SilA
MPIKARIDMLTTGIRTPVGLKVTGKTTDEVDAIAAEVEEYLSGIRGARSVFAERTAAGYYLDIAWDRAKLARYGLTIDDAQMVVANAIGGEEVSTVVDGRNRYPVNVRVKSAYRSDIEAISQLIVTDMDGKRAVSVADVADVRIVSGPSMIRDEDGMLTGYVYVDLDGRDPQSFVDEGKRVLAAELKLPTGATVLWSGQYENMQRVAQRLTLVVPITLALICILLYANLKSIQKTMIVLLAVPFSAIGAIWLVYALGFNMSIAVWVGLIALMGVDAETGVFMLLYLDLAYNKAKADGKLTSRDALREAVVAGAARRIRPKFMTVMTMFMGLVPVLWSSGAGSDVMQRIAAPMVGGIFTSFLLELLVYPAVYEVWKWRSEVSLMVDATREELLSDAEAV